MNLNKQQIKLTRNKLAIVDPEDFEKLNSLKWYAGQARDRFYACRTDVNQKRIYLHRFLLNIQDPKIFVDHINGNTLDNRKSNLRLCNNSENLYNRKQNKRNKSGYKGVHLNKNTNLWQAKITVDRKTVYIGEYKSVELAAQAYNTAAKKYFKEFARPNKI
jgi:hypothetical protein